MLSQRTRRITFWLIFSFLTITIIFYNLNWLLQPSTSYYDLGSFVAAGRFASDGKNPYSTDSPYIFQVNFSKAEISGIAPNLNPPLSVIIFEAFSQITPGNLLFASRTASLFLFLIILILLSATRSENRKNLFLILFSFSLAGIWHTLQLGQIYIYLLFLIVLFSFFQKRRNYWIAGVFLGFAAAIKPNLLYWILIIGVYGWWKTFLTSSLVFSVSSLLPLLKFGAGIYSQWIEASVKYTPDLLLFPGNNSLQALAVRLGIPEAGSLLGVALGLAVVIFTNKYKPETNSVNLLAITTTLLISPIAWVGYTIFLLPSFWFLKNWEVEHWIGGAIFCTPFIIILNNFEINRFNLIFFGWFYGWGLLILLVATFFRITKPTP